MDNVDSKLSPSIRSMIKWIAVGDILFGIALMLVGYYILEADIVQWFGTAIAIIGGLLYFVMRTLEKQDARRIN